VVVSVRECLDATLLTDYYRYSLDKGFTRHTYTNVCIGWVGRMCWTEWKETGPRSGKPTAENLV
jgi:hypothetical protein